MKEVRELLLNSDQVKEAWWDGCREMWQEVFGDSDAYLEYYRKYKWQENQVLALVSGQKELYSMLHINSYIWQTGSQRQTLPYIVAVSTRESQRGKGYMGRLLRSTFQLLYQQNIPWAYLMPAAEAIYTPYQFCSVYYGRSYLDHFSSAPFGERSDTKEIIEIKNYQELSESQKEELSVFAERQLQKKFTSYPVHSMAYLEEIAAQMRFCGGDLLVIFRERQIIGYTEWMYDGGEEIPAEFAETVLEEAYAEEAYQALQKNLLCRLNASELNVKFLESAFLPKQGKSEHCLMMARVVSVSEAAIQLQKPEDWKERVCCQITDPFLEENNGVWKFYFTGEKTVAERVQESPDFSLTIEEFTEILFRQQKIYMNDLV